MKIRMNKRRILSRLAHNQKYIWYVSPFIAKAEKIRERNERVQAIINKSVQEMELRYAKN